MQCVSKKLTNATLYCNVHGAPSRMVILTIRNIGLDIDLKYIDVFKGEQHTPEFIKINQLHQIPVLHTIEDNFILSESRAIIQYLASTAKSSLYPTDVKKRALVDSRLFFDASNVQIAVNNFVRLILNSGVKKIPGEVRDSIKVVLSNLETFLSKSPYFAGEELTIADLAFLASVETIKLCGANFNDYPNLSDWYERCRPLPGYQENQDGAKKLVDKLMKNLDEPLWK